MTHRDENSLQVKAYLKRMAADYASSPAVTRSDDIDGLMEALHRREAAPGVDGDLVGLAGRYAAAPDAARAEEIEALLAALSPAGKPS